MPAPSAPTKPSRSASKGRLAFVRLVVVRGERAHDGEAGKTELADARLGAAGDHDVGAAGADEVERVADGLGAGGAGGDDGVVVALERRTCIAIWAAAMFGSIFGM